MSEIWLQSMHLIVFVTNVSIQLMNQGTWIILSELCCSWIAPKMMSPDQEDPSKPIYIFTLPAHLTDNLQNLWHSHLPISTASHHPSWCIQHTQSFRWVTSIWYPPLNHWPPLRTWYAMWCLLIAYISRHRCYYNANANSTSPSLGREHPVEVRQWAAENMRICQENGGLKSQWKDNKVRERVWEIVQSMSISNEQGAGPKQCDLLIDYCVTQIRDLASHSLLLK